MSGDRHPFSRPQPVGALPKGGQSVSLAATAGERAAVAAFLDLPSLQSLDATFTLTPSRGGVHVVGEARARLHQTCVVTLEPFPSEIVEAVDVRFAPPEALGPVMAKEIERNLSDEDPPEPLIGGAVDLGALAVESVALGLDPFPRGPDAPPPEETPVADPGESPFAALAALRQPKGR